EAAFRILEAQLCAQLAQEQGLVVSTGGGALVNSGNRQALSATGTIICLTASIDTILDRVEQNTDRPLLQGSRDERSKRIRQLLHERRHAYSAIAIQVNTTGRTPAEIVDAILYALDAD